MKMLHLRWLDSSITLEWSPLDKDGLTEIETIGYLVYEDDLHIQVAQSIYENKYSAIQSIPKSVIIDRKEIEAECKNYLRFFLVVLVFTLSLSFTVVFGCFLAYFSVTYLPLIALRCLITYFSPTFPPHAVVYIMDISNEKVNKKEYN